MNLGPQAFDESVFVAKFNSYYKDGLTYLKAENADLLDPALLGPLLTRLRSQLDYNNLGLILTHKDNQALLKAYIGEMNFTGMSFTAALRKILTDFKFAGEAQIIDRIMENFGDKYFQDNQAQVGFPFKSKAACYVLGYSCVMLNSDLHNAKNKYKMTLEGFIKNNRGVNRDQQDKEFDFDAAFLSSIFNEIKQNEIKINHEQKASQYDGWCQGKGGYKFGYLTSYYILGYKPQIDEQKQTVLVSTIDAKLK